ncbi:MAG: hypothetical protein ABH830_04295 [Patescibacteria group bacterium]
MKKRNRLITCANCICFCQNQNKNKLLKMIRKINALGFKEIIFYCQALKDPIKEIVNDFSLKFYFKNNKIK